jgi:site-specific recombinase XerD
MTYLQYWKGDSNSRYALSNAENSLDFFGNECDVRLMKHKDILLYAQHLESLGLSNTTINRKLAALSKILTVAVERDIIPFKPKIPKYKEPKGRIRILTPREEVAYHF